MGVIEPEEVRQTVGSEVKPTRVSGVSGTHNAQPFSFTTSVDLKPTSSSFDLIVLDSVIHIIIIMHTAIHLHICVDLKPTSSTSARDQELLGYL